jgi:ribonuclease D
MPAVSAPVRYIDTPGQLQEFCAEMSGKPWLAVDTEFVREKTYYPQLCLVQVCDGETVACIDPIAITELSPLLSLLNDPGILKVFHAAGQDLELFYHLGKRVPAPVFDTQLAAALAGHGDQIGYANLVSAMLGVQLDKAHTRSDWARRPLSAQEIAYAADDVIYLASLYTKLEAELRQRHRLTWLEADFAELTDPRRFNASPDDAWERVGGAQRLRPAQLKTLRSLAAWREATARQLNRPRKWILADDLLLDISRRQPASIEDLKRIRGLPEGVITRQGDALLAAVAAGQGSEVPMLLEEVRRLPQELQPVVELLQAVVHVVAQSEQISVASLAGRRELEALAIGERDLDVLKGWRRTAVGEKLLAVAEGRASLAVENGRVVLRDR